MYAGPGYFGGQLPTGKYNQPLPYPPHLPQPYNPQYPYLPPLHYPPVQLHGYPYYPAPYAIPYAPQLGTYPQLLPPQAPLPVGNKNCKLSQHLWLRREDQNIDIPFAPPPDYPLEQPQSDEENEEREDDPEEVIA
ncbi:hypothetical protein RSOLAG1IB_01460 [Rhizoctonia solani AG-1 IB]|uniref:Uncharacterized protein n=1 Tax=Thanatephorus cucumeris (strain AG1-IB / isolate 7/3/14) TaxID=1108050 RepID=A0A0B7FGX5_THACB|nr:hypothetical protein RSOLAG1IB_01460 [Rhizoctonia solani AG-1 IB]